MKQRIVIGYIAKVHARKLHPWTVRLKSATDGLEEAILEGSRPRMVRGLEDVWFWVGRVVCDGLGAGDEPGSEDLERAAGAAIMEANQIARLARQFLSEEGEEFLAYAGKRNP